MSDSVSPPKKRRRASVVVSPEGPLGSRLAPAAAAAAPAGARGSRGGRRVRTDVPPHLGAAVAGRHRAPHPPHPPRPRLARAALLDHMTTRIRWWWFAAACALVVAPAAPAAADDEATAVAVSAVAASGSRAAGEALAALAAAALRARGVPARAAPPPAECAAGAGRACVAATLRALVGGALHAALLPVPAAAPPPVLLLRDAGLEELGDAAPPARLLCLATRAALAPAPRSLLDFADASVASRYSSSADRLATALRSDDDDLESTGTGSNATTFEFEPEWCAFQCATLVTGAESEARLLAGAARRHRLHVRVLALGERAAAAARRLAAAGPALLCDREPALDARFEPLGPPPCLAAADACPFEPYRLVKLVNARELVRSPSALRVLGRLVLSEAELRTLVDRARAAGPEAAAREALAKHREWAAAPGEVRAAVMLPAASRREAFDALALRAAAALAEEDAAHVAPAAAATVGFKVEVVDDGCAASLAFKYLTDALGAEYGALSAVAGPACGAAFADVARQSESLALPVIAYSSQAPPAGARAGAGAGGAGLTLLAGGDARQHTAAWAALLARMRWRRVAVLSELATRAALDVADLAADVIVHVELPGDGDEVDFDSISRWVARAAVARGRVLLVSAEDARVVRAALCAGRGAGLAPPAAAWLLPAALPPAWTRPAPADRHNCTRDEIEAAAEGHLSVAPAWLADWDADAAPLRPWATRWGERCRLLGGGGGEGSCSRPDAHSALLYDVLRLWADALRRLLDDRPAALDDLHQKSVVGALVEDATAVRYAGLTGEFEWTGAAGARARSTPLALLQWRDGARRRVGEYARGRLALDEAALRWTTADGRAPDDGGERCVLQPLADLLRADCRAAFVVVGAAVLALLVGALGGAAWHCKRRAEREYRDRLLALGLRTLGPKPGDLDRWEIPRERVVINRKLGTGAFGTVYGGHALLAEDRGWSAVAVKTLKAGASTEEKLDFLSEAEAMKRFDHKNVVRLLAVVTKTEPVCTVMEFMLYGDLKNYLLARRHLAGAADDAGDEVSAARLTGMALDCARALSYLAQLRYVHRDVAARNCLVSAHRVVKLADFGMTRLVFENDYYRFSRKGMLPVRWMAPESLALGVFSPASDVWSFGVLLYEIVTFGSLPFQGLSNAEVLARVKAGHTLDLPPGLKPQLEGLIKSCWQQEHKARPGAAEVAAFLADSPRLLAPCLDVPLDALPLDADADGDGDAPWRLSRDRAEARWVSWAAPPSAATDTTYLSADAPPHETDAFLP